MLRFLQIAAIFLPLTLFSSEVFVYPLTYSEANYIISFAPEKEASIGSPFEGPVESKHERENRIQREFEEAIILGLKHLGVSILPEHISWSEFRSTNETISKISEILNKNKEVEFTDPRLRKAVKSALSIDDYEEIRLEDLLKLTELEVGNHEIFELEGLQHAVNLEKLDLSFHNIEDISPIYSLKKLRSLTLSGNRVRNISVLSALDNLEYLNINSNKIRDISPISSLTKLRYLHLSDNEIDDISAIEKLINLDDLRIGNNKIRDIRPLWQLTKLEWLHASDNQIKDICIIENLSSLAAVALANNDISNVKPIVSNKAIKGRVDIRGNPLSVTEEVNEAITLLKGRGCKVETDKKSIEPSGAINSEAAASPR